MDSIAAKQDFRIVIFYVVLLFSLSFILTAVSKFLSKTREYLFIQLTYKLDSDMNRKCLNKDYECFNDSAMQDRILMVNQAVRGNNFFTSLIIVFDIFHILSPLRASCAS